MRIVGLIAMYAVVLFLTGWLLLKSTLTTTRIEQSSSFSFDGQTWSGSFPGKSKEVRPSNDSTGFFHLGDYCPLGWFAILILELLIF